MLKVVLLVMIWSDSPIPCIIEAVPDSGTKITAALIPSGLDSHTHTPSPKLATADDKLCAYLSLISIPHNTLHSTV
ncbi:hypothetical protein QL093DRAFT_2339316 [Fusarium oxysporum]|nr:hypothetical protein QL093DRAFT_2339316 [Fusarium oxysporum]